jgi:hypothetical protein
MDTGDGEDGEAIDVVGDGAACVRDAVDAVHATPAVTSTIARKRTVPLIPTNGCIIHPRHGSMRPR